jgi:hypothetical protein
MARSRHAMRVHPLRSKGVVVGVPVAAAVAFGAHTVLGVTPLSEQHDTQAASAPQAGAPVQSYGLASTPPPTTLGLLSGPSATAAPSDGGSGSTAATSHGAGAGTTKIGGTPAAAPAGSIPIARAASAPAKAATPSMMTFTPAPAAAKAAVPAAAPAAAPAVAPAATHEAAPQAAQRTAAPEPANEDAAGDQHSSGGSLLGVDLGVAKVSVLSFGG